MAKSPLLHQAERVDLIDLQYGLSGFSQVMQAKILRSFYGAGILDGFRIRVPDQTGNEKGHVVIYNGVAADWGGNVVNSETGTNSERIVLSAANMEYWIELELDYADTDPDSRAFWDPLVDNTDPLPDGQEVQIPRTMTRQVPFWRVRRPIRSNPVGVRSSAGYTPAHFSPNSDNVIPLAVIRTNNQRQVEIGDADSSAYGNDILPVLTQEDPINARNFVKVAGYGESHGTATAPYGRKFTDQRPRLFDPLLPSFQYGGLNEVLGDSLHDGWARDLASVFDHLASQVKQIKTGAGTGDHGETSTCTYEGFADDFSYVDVSSISQSIAGSLTADPDQFIGCTFQVVSGHWGGFYAQVMGNDRTGAHSAGETRLYLGRKSPVPEWMELPRGTVSCQIVQHREVNWLTKPCPSTGNRGLNALDTEVYSARTDWHSNTEFDNLRARLNAGKLATLTVAPVDTEDPDTGEPSTITHPRADVFQSVADIQTKVSSAFTDRGGIIHFRRGTYDFSSIAGDTVFSVSNADSFIIEGDGSETTVLECISAGNVKTIFSLSGCKDIIFRNLTIKTSGTPIKLSGCNNIHFDNCLIESEFVDLTTPSLELDSFTLSSFRETIFYLTGTGIDANSVNSSLFRRCRFFQRTESPTNTDSMMDLGSVAFSQFHDCYWSGYVATSPILCSSFSDSSFSDCEAAVTIDGSSADGILSVSGTIRRSMLHHLILRNNSSVVGTATFAGVKVGYLDFSVIDDVVMSGIVGGVYVENNMTRSSVSNIRAYFNNNAFGIQVDGSFANSVVDRCTLSTGGTSGVNIKISGSISNSYILHNDLNNFTQVDKGIEISSNNVENLIIQGNTCTRAFYGIYFNDVSGGRRLFVKDNVIDEIGGDAYFLKVSVGLQYFVFSGNHCSQVSGVGLTIDSTGVVLQKCLFHDNILDAVVRAFEIYSSAGGQLFDCQILGNYCNSTSKAAFAIGHSVKAGDPASNGYTLSSCMIKNNTANTSEATVTTFYSMYLSYVASCIVDNNYVSGGNDTSSLFVEKGTISSSISSNLVVGVIGSGSIGIQLAGSVVQDSRIGGNIVFTSGNNHHGIYVNQDTPASNDALSLTIVGNHAKSTTTAAAYGIHVEYAEHCNFSGNTTRNYNTGMWLRNSNECLVSTNILTNCATSFIDVSSSTDMKGSMTATTAGVDPQWPGDDVASNNVRAHNVGF